MTDKTYAFGDKADEKIDADRDALLSGEITTDPAKENWKQLGFISFEFTEFKARALCSMHLSIVDAHGDDFFVTSDNPVVTHSPSQPDNPGFGLKDATVWFPISYKRALLWHHGDRPPREVFTTRETRIKNRLMLKWCYKFIYSPSPDPCIEATARAETFNPCYGHYRTLNDVIGQSAPAFFPDGTPAGEIVEIGSVLKGGQPADVLDI